MTGTEIKTIELIVNSEQARKRLDELKTKLEELRNKREQALERGDAKALSTYTKEIKKVEREMERTETKATSMGRALKNLDKTAPKELKRTLSELNRELSSGKVQRGSAEWKTLTKAIRETKEAMNNVKKEIEVTNKSFSEKISSWGTKWIGFVMQVQTAMLGINSLRSLMQNAVSDYAGMEEAKAQVRKYTGLAAEDVDELNESLKAMDTRTPREKLNALAGDAGKLGITSKEQILDFVEAADKINVALGDDLGEGAVKNVGKLAMLFEEDQRIGLKGAMLSTASVINELSQNSSASAGYLEEFTARVAGVGKQAGLTQAQIMGFAAVLDENMQQDETSATAFSQLITKMYQEPAKFATLAGKDLNEFSRLLKEDANGALMAFFANLNAQGGFEQLAPMFEEMGLNGTRATAVLSSVADKLGNVEKMQRMATEAYSEASSIQKEYDEQNNTVQAGLDKAKENLKNISVELGERLMPIASKMMSTGTLSLKILSVLITWGEKYWKTIVSILSVIAVYNATLKITVAWEALHNLHLKTKVTNLLLAIKTTTLYKTAVQACTMAQGLFTVAVTLFTKGLTAARIQFALLTATMAKNPLGLIAVALSTVIGLVLQFTGVLGDDTEAVEDNTKALEKNAREKTGIEKARERAADNTDKERARIELLNNTLHSNTATLAQKKEALEELKRIIPDYHAHLSEEGKLENDNINAIKNYINALEDKAMAEALYEELVEQKKKEYQAKRNRERKENNVRKVQKQLNRNETFQSVPMALPDGSYVEMNMHRVIKQGELTKQQIALNKAMEEEKKELEKSRELNDELIKLNAKIEEKHKTASNTPATPVYSPTPTNSGTEPQETAASRIEKEANRNRLVADMEYATGISTYTQYQAELERIDREAAEKKVKVEKEGAAERIKAEREYYALLIRQRQKNTSYTISEINEEEEEETELAKAKYAEGIISEENYQKQLQLIRLKYADLRARTYEFGGDPDKAKQERQNVEKAELDDKIERRKEFLQKMQAFENEYNRKSLKQQKEDEITMLEEIEKSGLISKEQAARYREGIEKKYREKEKEAADNALKEEKERLNTILEKRKNAYYIGDPTEAITSSVVNLEGQLANLFNKIKSGGADWGDWAKAGAAALSFVSATMTAVSNLYQAQQEEEISAVQRKYEKQIAAAGTNSKRAKRLQEKQKKEEAAIKNKYQKRQNKIQLASAIAQTAQNALLAYGAMVGLFGVGPTLAAIAMAAALAAGAIQIAAIKKQQAAQGEYYKGGFTGGNQWRKEAGVVHEGEFVASHLAVRNPNILPILRLIDHAQRNNTIASITAADVSRAIAAPQATAGNTAATATAPALQIVDTNTNATRDALQRLNENLEAGIRASVSITGEDGFERQWNRYNKLKKA